MYPTDVLPASIVARLARPVAALAGAVALVAAAGTASARRAPSRDEVRPVHAPARATAARRTPVVVYVNRGGGVVGPGDDDAGRNTSSLAGGRRIRIPAWRGGEDAWRRTMACVRERFAPFDVDLVEQRPASGDYIMAMVGGGPSLFGYPDEVSGVAPFTGDVMPRSVVFVFAAGIEYDPELTCVDVLHEVGHALGLDHEYLCQDPMSYLWDCEEPKTFQDVDAACGEDEPRACESGATSQDSYRVLAANVGLRDGARPPATRPAPPQLGPPPGDGDGGDGGDDGDGGDGSDGAWPDDGDGPPGPSPGPPPAARAPSEDGPASRPDPAGELSVEIEGPAGVFSGNRVVTIVVTAHGDGVADATLGWATPDASYAFSCSAMPAGAPATCRRQGDTFVFQLAVSTGRRYFAAQVRDVDGDEVTTDTASFFLTP